jgi:hypothetical protein
MTLPIDLKNFLAQVSDVDLDTVFDTTQNQESATVGQQTLDQANEQTAVQGNEQDQDNDTTTVTEAGNGGNGGNALGGSANGGAGLGIGGDAGPISQSGQVNVNFGDSTAGNGIGVGGAGGVGGAADASGGDGGDAVSSVDVDNDQSSDQSEDLDNDNDADLAQDQDTSQVSDSDQTSDLGLQVQDEVDSVLEDIDFDL